MKHPIVIVGAGLSGLRAASLLISHGIECRVLEARGRIGGRVLSTTVSDRPELGEFDLGPTWFWPEYEHAISDLVRELGLPAFEQYTKGAMLFEQSPNGPIQRHELPEGTVGKSFRLVGGVQSLIDAVAATIPEGTVEVDTRVTAIQMGEEGAINVEAEHAGKKKLIPARAVILALPPRLIAERIAFSPSFPADVLTSLKDKPTWMAGHAKVIAVYDRPFWREAGLSGQVTSWAGPLQEIHDASPETGSGALFGFFSITAKARQELGEDKVLELVVAQLARLFGPTAAKPVALLYKDWSSDAETAVAEDAEPLTSFPEYGLPLAEGPWEKKILFAGTEAAPESGGHLEGALQSAEQAASMVMDFHRTHP
ncbi:FAD-dependent oxidoreductase [Bacillus sp. REN3]|uniref:flavin monoamine oxidase family protein n=1 Tax=Bacillus sp. REN3 TaxID=2802440 RepID=UPI001AEDF149|nr:FAD-dependent oxidoreductase [Bacillus sp. REN3]